MTIAERLKALLDKRKALMDKLQGLVDKAAGEDRDLNDEENELYETGKSEVEALDKEMESVEKKMKFLMTSTESVSNLIKTSTSIIAPMQPGLTSAVKPKSTISPLVRAAIVFALGKMVGPGFVADDYIKARWGEDADPLIKAYLSKAAVAIPLSTMTIVNQDQYRGDLFVELLRNASVFFRITGKRDFDFAQNNKVSIPRQTGGFVAGWVGEANSIPVSTLTSDEIELSPKKLAGLISFSNELLRRSSPSVEGLLQDDMVQGASAALDTEFWSTTAATSTRPGGILAAASLVAGGAITVATATLAQLDAAFAALYGAMKAANAPMVNPHWVMPESFRTKLALLRNSVDGLAYPSIAANNTLLTIPIVASNAVATNYGIVDGNQVFYGEELPIQIDSSEVATFQSNDAPATPPTPLQSAFQQDLTVFRLRETVDWDLRYAGAASVVYGVLS